ncbi:Hypothetical Protein FCC1311_020412 [Hondaea fermentalgiana]|uniref:NYN domain-containing protein n=1 Tax=Hondaea fermentalgiana TaxID=2315210 RepID=A0A2R5G466_9STRA|nr:Hypothetical Protein FCC1311_020412 [Hondaea fermentalgiana]|eukprot:GBG25822.1 Hypothetical Protein FCC1311_020412 [Hondaea fermentalgiana]
MAEAGLPNIDTSLAWSAPWASDGEEDEVEGDDYELCAHENDHLDSSSNGAAAVKSDEGDDGVDDESESAGNDVHREHHSPQIKEAANGHSFPGAHGEGPDFDEHALDAIRRDLKVDQGNTSIAQLLRRFRKEAPVARTERADITNLFWWSDVKKTSQAVPRASGVTLSQQENSQSPALREKRRSPPRLLDPQSLEVQVQANEPSVATSPAQTSPLDIGHRSLSFDSQSRRALDHGSSKEGKRRKRVRVLWDIENVHVPHNLPAFEVARALSHKAEELAKVLWGNDVDIHADGPLSRIFCFYDPFKKTLSRVDRKELVSAFVTLVDIGKDKAGMADLLIVQELNMIMQDFPASEVLIILVSGDTDFVPTIRNAAYQGYNVACLGSFKDAKSTAYRVYREFAWKVLDWESILTHVQPTVTIPKTPRRGNSKKSPTKKEHDAVEALGLSQTPTRKEANGEPQKSKVSPQESPVTEPFTVEAGSQTPQGEIENRRHVSSDAAIADAALQTEEDTARGESVAQLRAELLQRLRMKPAVASSKKWMKDEQTRAMEFTVLENIRALQRKVELEIESIRARRAR